MKTPASTQAQNLKQKHVKISLIAFAETPKDIPKIEDRFLPFTEAIASFYNGAPKQASKAFTDTIKGRKGPEKVTLDSLDEIRDAFASTSAQGAGAVAGFIGSENARVDSINE